MEGRSACFGSSIAPRLKVHLIGITPNRDICSVLWKANESSVLVIRRVYNLGESCIFRISDVWSGIVDASGRRFECEKENFGCIVKG